MGSSRISIDGAAGSTITVVSGTMAFVKVENDETATLNGDMILDGGVLRYAGDDVGGDNPIGTLEVVNLSINSASTIEAPPGRDVFFTIDGTLTGSGNVNFLGDDGQSSEITVNAVSGYTGNSEVNSGLILGFDTDYSFPGTFALNDTGSRLNLFSGRTLTFNEGSLTDPVNGVVAPGTYSSGDLGANYQGPGTITVIPEPSTGVLMVTMLGAFYVLSLRRKRR